MDSSRVFNALARMVAAGEYLDAMPGKPGINVEGGGMFLGSDPKTMRRLYYRGSDELDDARERGWVDPLPPLQPAPLASVEEAELLAGAPLPLLLRQLYLEVGNGGFGPGCGLLGLRGGFSFDRRTALSLLGQVEPGSGGGPRIPLLLCDWGSNITSQLDLADGQVWGRDPNPAPPGVSCCFPEGMDIAEWFGRWITGALFQPWLVQDATTGQWRGATYDEHLDAHEEDL